MPSIAPCPSNLSSNIMSVPAPRSSKGSGPSQTISLKPPAVLSSASMPSSSSSYSPSSSVSPGIINAHSNHSGITVKTSTGASVVIPAGVTIPIPAKSSVIKTDKPRPHVCLICTRSFARLEHLKRHERSHTKEKPFECPVCQRCFARRDLLLRHKQKLHASFPDDQPRRTARRRTREDVNDLVNETNQSNQNQTNQNLSNQSPSNQSPSDFSNQTSSNQISPNVQIDQNHNQSTDHSQFKHQEMAEYPTYHNVSSIVGSVASPSTAFVGSNPVRSGDQSHPNSKVNSNVFQFNPNLESTTSNISDVTAFPSPRVIPTPYSSHSDVANTPVSTFSSHNSSTPAEFSHNGFHSDLYEGLPVTSSSISVETTKESPHFDKFDSTSAVSTTSPVLSVSAAAQRAAQLTMSAIHDDEATINDSQTLDHLMDFKNQVNSNGRRARPASFSAASTATYKRTKDILPEQHHEFDEVPSQVGFATPQLVPMLLNIQDLDMGSLDEFLLNTVDDHQIMSLDNHNGYSDDAHTMHTSYYAQSTVEDNFQSHIDKHNEFSLYDLNHEANHDFVNPQMLDHSHDPLFSNNSSMLVTNDDFSWLNDFDHHHHHHNHHYHFSRPNNSSQHCNNANGINRNQNPSDHFAIKSEEKDPAPMILPISATGFIPSSFNTQRHSTTSPILHSDAINIKGVDSPKSVSASTPSTISTVLTPTSSASQPLFDFNLNGGHGVDAISPSSLNDQRSHSIDFDLDTELASIGNNPSLTNNAVSNHIYGSTNTITNSGHTTMGSSCHSRTTGNFSMASHRRPINADNISYSPNPITLSLKNNNTENKSNGDNSGSGSTVLTDNEFSGHAYHNSVRTPIVTPQLRLYILNTLSKPSPFTTNKSISLPPTIELQRYINIFGQYFGRHLPFLHNSLELGVDNFSLALSMASIGALYLFEHNVAANLFEISKLCIHVYLESQKQRQKNQQREKTNETPLWLTQALALGVVYGLFNNDPLANDIAISQANAVVNLCRSSGLNEAACNHVTPISAESASLDDKWQYFIAVQERVRTIHAVHIVSCILNTTYCSNTGLNNDMMRCGSPCDESLWNASSANEWWQIMKQKELDNSLKDAVMGPSYVKCLEQLMRGHAIMDKVPQFALLSLIYGIHLEIINRMKQYSSVPIHEKDDIRLLWLKQEKGPLEAALRAWETTWSLSPLASLNPNSQFGPLMADAIPLASLAHVRIHVDLRRVKQALWKRDFTLMGHLLNCLNLPVVVPSNVKSSETMYVSNGLLDAASYSVDTISLWEKHSVKWTLESTACQTFIHTLNSIFNCGLIISEFLRRLEIRPQNQWQEDERLLWLRVRKILSRVMNIINHNQRVRKMNDGLQNGNYGFTSSLDLAQMENGINVQTSSNHQGRDSNVGTLNKNSDDNSLNLNFSRIILNDPVYTSLLYPTPFDDHLRSIESHESASPGASEGVTCRPNEPNDSMNPQTRTADTPKMGSTGSTDGGGDLLTSKGAKMSILALVVVGQILSSAYVWPFVKVMTKALEERAKQIQNMR
ncbi:hypothetical protein NADFUDRAFT_84492 [Nadsonia fulvescens var. elongata DSM 6958]|uniref:C2H2-type domain-containing protein n=1 Tax=Nadsonia fulvescens var. elongata DSM 6958 TaxID=857566 RepID=A0A1E3PEP6_9ASCO|nr:hypothetical protein NADFUDRAFT_84492 [Nadsonia fulvescens var. elongata DSM 6958]